MATEKAESKPSTRKVDEDEEQEYDAENHPLTLARAEGQARNPLWQTSNIDTTEGGGLVDIRKVSPMFEQARRDAVRHAAAVLDPEDDTPDDPNVILPDDEVEAERARADLKRQVAELGDPEDDPVVIADPHGGHGDLMGAEGQQGRAPSNPEADQSGEGEEGTKSEGDKPIAGATSKPATKPGTSETASKASASRTSTASKTTRASGSSK